MLYGNTSKYASRKLPPTTKFKHAPKSFEHHTITEFWQWAHSDLMQNIERGVLAEYIVATLLGVDSNPRVPWLAYDLKMPNEKTIEVKAMSRLQAWYQKNLSNPLVIIKPTRKWDPETNIMENEPRLHSDFYVICYFTAVSHELADPLDLAQWKFFVLPKDRITSILQKRRSISMKFLEELGIEPVAANQLRDQIVQLCDEV
jgi:hypothetical protein